MNKIDILYLSASVLFSLAYVPVAYGATYQYEFQDLFTNPIQLQVGDTIQIHNSQTLTKVFVANDTDNVLSSGLIHKGETANMTFLYNGTYGTSNLFNPAQHGTIIVGGSFPQSDIAPMLSQPVFSESNSTQLTFQDSNATQASFGESNATEPILSQDLSKTPGVNDTIVFQESNSTQVQKQNTTVPENETVAYWKAKADYWQGLYENLLQTLKGILGLL